VPLTVQGNLVGASATAGNELVWMTDGFYVDALTQTEADARYPLKTDPNPYPTYATDADLTAHVGAADPHPVYLTQTEGDARYQQPAAADAAYVNVTGDTLTGDLIFTSPAKITAPSRGNRIGDLGATAYSSAVPDTDASILLYRVSATNWSGIGGDGSGNMWWKVGISGSPAPLLQLTANPLGLRVAGQLENYGGYAYLGSYNTQAYPRQGTDLAVAWNWSGGQAEMSLWNTVFNPTRSFSFRQLLTASTSRQLLDLYADGRVLTFGPVTAGSDATARVTGEIMATRAATPTHGLVYFGTAGSCYALWPGSGDIGFTHRIAAPGLLATSDIMCYRAGTPSTGYVFLNSGGSRYIGFDGTYYQLPGARAMINGRTAVTTVNVNAKHISVQGWSGNGGVQTVEMGVGTHAFMAFIVRVTGACQLWWLCSWPGVGNMATFLNQGSTPTILNAGYCNVAQSYLYTNISGEPNAPNSNGVYYLGFFVGSSDA